MLPVPYFRRWQTVVCQPRRHHSLDLAEDLHLDPMAEEGGRTALEAVETLATVGEGIGEEDSMMVDSVGVSPLESGDGARHRRIEMEDLAGGEAEVDEEIETVAVIGVTVVVDEEDGKSVQLRGAQGRI